MKNRMLRDKNSELGESLVLDVYIFRNKRDSNNQRSLVLQFSS